MAIRRETLGRCKENQDLQGKKVKWKTLEENKDWQEGKDNSIFPCKEQSFRWQNKAFMLQGKMGIWRENKEKLTRR